MRTPLPEKRFRELSLTVFVVSMVMASAMIPGQVIAQGSNQTMTTGSMVRTYDELETELLRRFDVQVKNHDPELTATVRALGHVRSKRAIPLLLSHIDVVPGRHGEKVGDFYPVRIVGASTYKDVYPVLDALVKIGSIPVAQCIAELEKAQDGSLRETLLANLGQGLHGKAFVQEIRSRASSPKGKEKWERLLGLLPQD
jgi:hypothetical protein